MRHARAVLDVACAVEGQAMGSGTRSPGWNQSVFANALIDTLAPDWFFWLRFIL